MREREHLTKNQIAGYRAGGAFDAHERREIGRHLIKCESCRKSLPPPTFEGFWDAVMTERETEQTSASDESEFSRHSGFSSSLKVFGRFSSLAWSGAGLIVLFGFSLLLWLNDGWRWNQEKEVAQTFNSNATEFNSAQINSGERSFPNSAQTSRDNKQASSPGSDRPINPKSPQASVPQNDLNSSLQENASRNSISKIPKDTPGNISSTRGGVLPVDCGETPVETEVELSGEAVTLKWKKVPNAVKYHLYISDDEEILIDEFETERETSYTLKKSLDAAKTYKWKVVVTTEDGKTIVGDSQKFTIKGLQLNRNKSEKKVKQQIRCSEDK